MTLDAYATMLLGHARANPVPDEVAQGRAAAVVFLLWLIRFSEGEPVLPAVTEDQQFRARELLNGEGWFEARALDAREMLLPYRKNLEALGDTARLTVAIALSRLRMAEREVEDETAAMRCHALERWVSWGEVTDWDDERLRALAAENGEPQARAPNNYILMEEYWRNRIAADNALHILQHGIDWALKEASRFAVPAPELMARYRTLLLQRAYAREPAERAYGAAQQRQRALTAALRAMAPLALRSGMASRVLDLAVQRGRGEEVRVPRGVGRVVTAGAKSVVAVRAGREAAKKLEPELTAREWPGVLGARRHLAPQLRAFGVEIEVVGVGRKKAAEAVADGLVRAGEGPAWARGERSGRGVRYSILTHQRKFGWATRDPLNRPSETWIVERDQSLPQPTSAEVVSPILRGSAIERVRAVLLALQRAGGATSPRTAVHVHVDGRDLDGAAITQLLVFVRDHEAQILAHLGVSERRVAKYTKITEPELVRLFEGARPQTRTEAQRLFYDFYGGKVERMHQARYHGLNLNSLFFRGSVEFRWFEGSLDPETVIAYIRFAVALVDAAASGIALPPTMDLFAVLRALELA